MLTKNKKAQIGETLTWIVATIIIIVILAISMIVTVALGRRKYEDIEFIREADLLTVKSLSSYLLTHGQGGDFGKKVFQQLKEEENLNEFNGNLAKNIFLELYSNEYRFIWLVVYSKPRQITHNKYFEKPAPCARGISEEIKLKEDKYLLSTFTERC